MTQPPPPKLPAPHHDSKGFHNNYTGSVTRTFRELLRWQYQRLRAGLPHAPQQPTPEVSAELEFIARNAVSGAAMVPSVTWIGHATALVQASGLNVLTDPVFSTRVSPFSCVGPKRAHAPGLSLAQLPHIDVVVVSHNHYDHLDRDSIVALARQPGGPPLFLVPLGIKRWLARCGITHAVELDWWESARHGAVEFYFTPAQHWSGRGIMDRNRTLWGSWSSFGVDFQWYFSGDTGYSPDFADIRERFAARQSAAQGGGFDVALIAVGACEPRWFMKPQHVDPADAVQVHRDLGAKRSVGVHWGTFQLSDEPLDHALTHVAAARAAQGIGEEEFCLLPLGGTRRFAVRSV